MGHGVTKCGSIWLSAFGLCTISKSATKSFYGDVVHWVWIGGVSRDIHHGGDQQFGSGEIHRGALVVIQNIERDFGGIDDFYAVSVFWGRVAEERAESGEFYQPAQLGHLLTSPNLLMADERVRLVYRSSGMGDPCVDCVKWGGSLAMSYLFSKSAKTRWLLP